MTTSALILSGGGANGAFQAGALKALGHTDYDVVAGVSVGALNGAMVAQNKLPELLDIWNNITEQQVYKKFSTPRVIWRLLNGADSLYDLSPLRKLIDQHVHLEDLQRHFLAGVVNTHTSTYHAHSSFSSSRHLRDVVYCSAVMPVIWSPSTINGRPHHADGGLRNIAPLADVISELPDRIIIILCQPVGLNLANVYKPLDILKRTIEIMTAEIVDNDLDKLLTINQLVLQARDQGAVLTNPKNGKTYKYFETLIIRPQEALGDATDFSRQHIDRCFAAGIDAVRNMN